MPRLRLFTEGTHNGLTFSAEAIGQLFENSKTVGQVPIVLGHPKNDLPVVGYVNSADFEQYDEEGKKSIGFDRAKAEVSTDMLDFIKSKNHAKISVRINKEGKIGHIGLVKDPAVLANQYQDFSSDEDKYFDSESDFDFETADKKLGFFEKLQKKLSGENKKEDEKTDDFSQKNAYDKKLAEVSARQNLMDFEKQIDSHSDRVTPKLKEQLMQVATDMVAEGMDFSDNSGLQNLVSLAETLPKHGTEGVVADFSQAKQRDAVEQELANQFKNLK